MSKVVMPDLTRALQGIRHPVYSWMPACETVSQFILMS